MLGEEVAALLVVVAALVCPLCGQRLSQFGRRTWKSVARPKSDSLRWPERSTRKLSGLMSLGGQPTHAGADEPVDEAESMRFLDAEDHLGSVEARHFCRCQRCTASRAAARAS